MKVSRNWLKTFFEKDIPTSAELTELFTFHAFEVEGVEKIWKDGDRSEDYILDLKILPDRAHYCLSHRGIAEEIQAITGQFLKKPRDFPAVSKSNSGISTPKVTIMADKFCRRYVARRIEQVQVTAAPNWMQERLRAIGERSINSIVDTLNFMMFDSGQPLHAFDADKVKGDIVVRAAKEGETIVLLDEKEITLTPADYVIADEIGPLAIAGVKGGNRAAVTFVTKNLIIESANFDPTIVRRTASRLNLRNESSKRFENEITPELASQAIFLVSAMIGAVTPSSIDAMSEILDIYPERAPQNIISMSREYVSERLGIDVPEKDFNAILARLSIIFTGMFQFTEGSPITFMLTVPYHRLDLSLPEDIVEEVGRIYGYHKIKGHLPVSSAKSIEISKSYYLSEKIKNILVKEGFSEVNLYTFVSDGEGDVKILYPLSSDKSSLRSRLATNLNKCMRLNISNAELLGLTEVKIFEIGRVFGQGEGESLMLGLGAAQIKKIKGRDGLSIIKEITDKLEIDLNVRTDKLAKSLDTLVDKGAVFEISLDEILESYQLPQDASYADLGFGPAAKTIYKKFSAYPFIVRDIAVFTPEDITADNVWSAIEKGIQSAQSMPLLARHALFDTFQKDGRISYAFRMVFQSNEKTLTDTEIAAVMEQINAQMKASSWEVR